MTKYHSNRTDCYFWLGASAEAETGSREPGVASRPGPTGFDPARCQWCDGRFFCRHIDSSQIFCSACGAPQ